MALMSGKHSAELLAIESESMLDVSLVFELAIEMVLGMEILLDVMSVSNLEMRKWKVLPKE